MTDPTPLTPPEPTRLLGRDYWMVTSTPAPGTTAEQIGAVVAEHITWLLALESSGVLLASGPLTSGPDIAPGSGVTVLRATDAQHAQVIAAQDPFVLAGLRTFVVHGWRLNEGSVSVRVSLGSGTFDWLD